METTKLDNLSEKSKSIIIDMLTDNDPVDLLKEITDTYSIFQQLAKEDIYQIPCINLLEQLKELFYQMYLDSDKGLINKEPTENEYLTKYNELQKESGIKYNKLLKQYVELLEENKRLEKSKTKK